MDQPADGPDFAELDFGNSDPSTPEIVGEKVPLLLDRVYIYILIFFTTLKHMV